MWVSKRYLTHLEAENADLKAQVRALTNTVFAVQGAPAPFETRTTVPDELPPPRSSDVAWLAELEAITLRENERSQ